MKAQHLRRAPYRPRLELAIGLLGLAICGLGIGLATADVMEKNPAEVRPQQPTTTTTMIVASAIEPETTTTTSSPAVPRKAPPVFKKAVAPVAPSSSTTTTTESPKTPLEVALKYVGQTGPWAEGGFDCAKFTSYVAQEAGVEGFISRDGPSALYADAKSDGRLTQEPVLGGMVFIDLFGPGGIGHGQPTHVAILESVEGDELTIIQANGKPDPSVITRTTYHLNDGYVLAFAPFEEEAA